MSRAKPPEIQNATPSNSGDGAHPAGDAALSQRIAQDTAGQAFSQEAQDLAKANAGGSGKSGEPQAFNGSQNPPETASKYMPDISHFDMAALSKANERSPIPSRGAEGSTRTSAASDTQSGSAAQQPVHGHLDLNQDGQRDYRPASPGSLNSEYQAAGRGEDYRATDARTQAASRTANPTGGMDRLAPPAVSRSANDASVRSPGDYRSSAQADHTSAHAADGSHSSAPAHAADGAHSTASTPRDHTPTATHADVAHSAASADTAHTPTATHADAGHSAASADGGHTTTATHADAGHSAASADAGHTPTATHADAGHSAASADAGHKPTATHADAGHSAASADAGHKPTATHADAGHSAASADAGHTPTATHADAGHSAASADAGHKPTATHADAGHSAASADAGHTPTATHADVGHSAASADAGHTPTATHADAGHSAASADAGHTTTATHADAGHSAASADGGHTTTATHADAGHSAASLDAGHTPTATHVDAGHSITSATADHSVPATTADHPVPATTADHPVPATTADHPVPATTADHPVPATTADHPVPATTADHPVPATTADHPVPATTADHPAPATAADHPAPAAAADHSAPAAAADHSAPAAAADHPAPATAADHPLPATAAEHPAPATAADHPAPATAADHPAPATVADHPAAATTDHPATATAEHPTTSTVTGRPGAAQVEAHLQRTPSPNGTASRPIVQAASAPVSDSKDSADRAASPDRSIASNQQLRTSQMLDTEKNVSELSRKSTEDRAKQLRLASAEEDRIDDFGRKGEVAKTDGSRTTDGKTRGESSNSSSTFGRSSDDFMPGMMDQKTMGRLLGTVSADQVMQQNGSMLPDGSRADFMMNPSGNIVNLREGRAEGVSSHSRHRAGSESSGARSSDAATNSLDTSQMPTGLMTGQGQTDTSNVLNQAPQDRSIFSGASNHLSNLGAAQHSQAVGHGGSSKTSHSSTEPGNGKSDPGSTTGQNNASSFVSGNGQNDPTASGQNSGSVNGSQTASLPGQAAGGIANTPGSNNDPVSANGSKNGTVSNEPSKGTSTTNSGVATASGQSDPNGQTNANGQSNGNKQTNGNGQPDPNGQVNGNGQPNANGQAFGGGFVTGTGGDQGDQYYQPPIYGQSDPSGNNLMGLLGSVLFGLGEGLLSEGGNGVHIGRAAAPLEYGPASLSLLNQMPGTFDIGNNSISNPVNTSQSSEVQQSAVTESQVTNDQWQSTNNQVFETNILSGNPDTYVYSGADQVYQGSNQGYSSSDPGFQSVDSATYTGNGAYPPGSVGGSPGTAGGDSGVPGNTGASGEADPGSTPLKASIEYNAGTDPTSAGTSPIGAPVTGGDSTSNQVPNVDFVGPSDPVSLNPNVPGSANQSPVDPSSGDGGYPSPDGTGSVTNHIPFVDSANPADPSNMNPNAPGGANQISGNPPVGDDNYQLPDGTNPLLADSGGQRINGVDPFFDDANGVGQDPGVPSSVDWPSADATNEEHLHTHRHLSNLNSDMGQDDGTGANGGTVDEYTRREIAEPEYQDDDNYNGVQHSEVMVDGSGGVSTPEETESFLQAKENAVLEEENRKLQEEADYNKCLEQERLHREEEARRAKELNEQLADAQAQGDEEEQAKRLLALLQIQEEQIRKDNQQQRYVVKRGDTLEKIALAIFQDISLVPLIYALNKRLIGRQIVDGKPVYALKENTVLSLPSPKMIREWRQKRLLHTFTNETTVTTPVTNIPENEAARARRANIEKYLGPLGYAPSFSDQLRVNVRLGDTLRSIAMKHPELGDIALWRLLAECNGLSTAVDAKGLPVAVLKRGSSLFLPTKSEIAEYRARHSDRLQPIAPRHGLKAAMERSKLKITVIETDDHIPLSNSGTAIQEQDAKATAIAPNAKLVDGQFVETLTESCRIVQTNIGADTVRQMRAQLEVLLSSFWIPVLTYAIKDSGSVRYEHSIDGTLSAMSIDLPMEAAVQLVHNDLHANWHNYCRKFLKRCLQKMKTIFRLKKTYTCRINR